MATIETPPPALSEGMHQVTKEAFFVSLYADPRDVMPMIDGPWSDSCGYVSEWRDRSKALFGVSDNGGDNGSRYWLVALPEPKKDSL